MLKLPIEYINHLLTLIKSDISKSYEWLDIFHVCIVEKSEHELCFYLLEKNAFVIIGIYELNIPWEKHLIDIERPGVLDMYILLSDGTEICVSIINFWPCLTSCFEYIHSCFSMRNWKCTYYNEEYTSYIDNLINHYDFQRSLAVLIDGNSISEKFIDENIYKSVSNEIENIISQYPIYET